MPRQTPCIYPRFPGNTLSLQRINHQDHVSITQEQNDNQTLLQIKNKMVQYSETGPWKHLQIKEMQMLDGVQNAKRFYYIRGTVFQIWD